MRIEEITKKIIDAKVDCRWCGTRIQGLSLVHFSHEGGITVEFFDKPQWIYFPCKKCNYKWSLWKILQQIKVKASAT